MEGKRSDKEVAGHIITAVCTAFLPQLYILAVHGKLNQYPSHLTALLVAFRWHNLEPCVLVGGVYYLKTQLGEKRLFVRIGHLYFLVSAQSGAFPLLCP